jgi:hypothetical protein
MKEAERNNKVNNKSRKGMGVTEILQTNRWTNFTEATTTNKHDG